MEQETVRRLLRRYANGDCTEQEQRLLEDLVLRNPMVGDWDWSSEEEKVLMGIRIKQAIDERRFRKNKPQKSGIVWYGSIAASLLIAIGVWWFVMDRPVEDPSQSLQISETSPFPADGIRLTLADGSVIGLDSVQNGLVRSESGLTIRKIDGEQLEYEVVELEGDAANGVAPPSNTIHVPNGKQFQLTLPDGTGVWINTASALTYPVRFSGSERKVQLEGEAYFEVVKNAKKPFKVVSQGVEIVVTGTHFNVSAYPSDGKVVTTLVEGGVDVRKGGTHVSLTPGYQATTYAGAETIEKQKGNIEQTMAWKNGYFVFDDMDAVSVMRSVARWYDVRVSASGKIPDKHFGGSFPITAGLDELLADLEMVGKIKFERKGKEVRIIW